MLFLTNKQKQQKQQQNQPNKKQPSKQNNKTHPTLKFQGNILCMPSVVVISPIHHVILS